MTEDAQQVLAQLPPEVAGRVTERAKKALMLAHQEAVRLHHRATGPRHLFLGVLREGRGVGARVLIDLGIDVARVSEALLVHSLSDGEAAGALAVRGRAMAPLTERTLAILHRAAEEADALHHHYIGQEHLLLAIVRDGGDAPGQPAVRLLADLGVSADEVRRAVLRAVPSAQSTWGASAAPRARGMARPRDNVVTCRVDDSVVDALDALVDAGVYRTRSEAAGRLIVTGLEASRTLMERVYAASAETHRGRTAADSPDADRSPDQGDQTTRRRDGQRRLHRRRS